MISDRIKKLSEMLPEGIDGMLVTSEVNRFYLTGMRSSAGVLLVTHKGSALVIDFRYIEAAKATVKNAEVILQDKLGEQLSDLCKKYGVSRLAVETSYITLAKYRELCELLPNVELTCDTDSDRAIIELRKHKDSAELACIKEAQRITDAGFEHILGYIREGITERQIAAELEYFMKGIGAEKTSFSTISICGVNTSLPHGVPGDNKVKKGDFITMDFGVVYGGYCSDMTRTVALGNVTEEMAKVYDIVLKAQLAALDKAALGVNCRDVDKAARDIIYSAGYEGCFGHGTGHSVGIEIHESPRFAISGEGVCEPGMVMTVEPGIYLEEKFGCRIEDMIYFTEKEVKNLTNSPKNLIIL